jgi:hypothetical protein
MTHTADYDALLRDLAAAEADRDKWRSRAE